MADNLRRRVLMVDRISNVCVMCNKEESMDHLLLHYEVASSIWSHFFCKRGVA